MSAVPSITAAELDRARELVAGAERIAAFTGAGVSAESGIPTFRGRGGLWDRVPIEQFGTPWGVADLLERDPARLAGHLVEVGQVVLAAQPNPAHRAIGALERAGRGVGVITQNVDDLHELAGSTTVHKLHGDLFRWRCTTCGATRPMDRNELRTMVEGLADAGTAFELLNHAPDCLCGGRFRPDVVLFGEMLPGHAVSGAERLLRDADLILIVGTSGTVEPAAGLAREALARGVPAIEINLEPGGLSDVATVGLYGPAGEVLPKVVGEPG